MTYLEQDKFLRDLSQNLKQALGYLEEGDTTKAKGFLQGTIWAIKDTRNENLKVQKRTNQILDEMEYKRNCR
ncbi:conserved domain protein [Peptoniphilus sp. oral taxon 375 str. F0436]|nr:conserved domain protein [Peptoniphilus sp. oral taxon 375 str. F0436]